MKTRIAALAAVSAAIGCAPAYAAPTTVNVRVEGLRHTIYDATVSTTAHAIAKDSSGSHPCDGTNGGANSAPGPTATGALDDASRDGGFAWSGSWSSSFQDFLVNQIGPDAGTASRFWLVAVNYQPLQVGGCQYEVKPGDQVLWYYGSGEKYLLTLSGPHRAVAGHAFRVKVLDGTSGKPVADARVGRARTNANGVAHVVVRHAGRVRLRATLPGSLRSAPLVVRVRRLR